MQTKKKSTFILFFLTCILSLLLNTVVYAEGEILEGTDYNVTYNVNGSTFIITNSRAVDTVNITAVKVWDDAGNQDNIRPDSVSFQLFKEGNPYQDPKTVTPDSSGNWVAVWEGLQKNDSGTPIVYTVEEVNTPGGYTSAVESDGFTEFTIKNSHTPKSKDITVKLEWSDEENRDGIRPEEVTVNVTDSKGNLKTVTLNKDNGFSKTVTFEENTPGQVGVPNQYKAEITDLPDTYSYTPPAPAPGDISLLAEHIPARTEFTVTKVWDDDDNRDNMRTDSVSVRLLANGNPVGEPKTISSDTWTETWTDLYVNENGSTISYSAEEITNISGYTPSVSNDGKTVTNRHEINQKTITIDLSYDDDENRDGIRPSVLTIEVKDSENNVVAEVTVDEATGSTATFEVPENEKGEVGIPAVYTYEIKDLPDTYEYQAPAPSDGDTSLVVSHDPELVDINVVVKWDDFDNRDNLRPETVDVTLTGTEGSASGVVSGTGNEWNYTFNNQYKYSNGQLNEFSISGGTAGPEYITMSEKNGDYSFMITNSHAPLNAGKEIVVNWNDDNNRDGIRPDSVTVSVKNEAGEEVATVVLTRDGDTFKGTVNVPQNAEGQVGVPAAYTYEITDLPDTYTYEKPTNVTTNTTIITATHIPERVDITVKASWADKDNQDNLRPSSISVSLGCADGTEEKAVTGTGNNWTAVFENQFKYNNGQPNVFTLTGGEGGADYITTLTKESDYVFNVLNSRDTDKIIKTITVEWDDEDDRDGIRPDEITVVVRDSEGKEVGTVTLTNEDGKYVGTIEVDANKPGKVGEPEVYTYEFKDLPDTYTDESEDPGTNDEITMIAKHIPERIDIIVHAEWYDNDNQDRVRPGEISVTLSDKDGSSDASVSGNGNTWTVTISNRYKYSNGQPNVFTLTGGEGGGDYSTEIEKNSDSEFTVKNSRSNNKVSRTANIIWNDDNDRDGLRPEALTLLISANGVQTSITGSAEESSGWKKTFNDLDENIAGNPINYAFQIIESVPGYTYEFSEDRWTVTYTHVPVKTNYSAEIVWNDNNDNDGKRPETVTVELYRNGVPTGDVKVFENGITKVTWTDLDKNENGEPIVYTVRVVGDSLAEYNVDYTDSETKTTIDAAHDVEVVKILYSVEWDDNNNQDGLRPNSLTVRLTDDKQGQVDQNIGTDGTAEGSFNNLRVRKNGEIVTYSLTVVPVPSEYTLDVKEKQAGEGSGNKEYAFVLKHIPYLTHLFSIVEWDDHDDIDGIRPTSMDVCLVANGERTGLKVDLPIYGSYTNDFRFLDKRESGNDIQYEITLCNGVPDGYTQTYAEGGRIVLKHDPEGKPGDIINKTVRIEWDDDDNTLNKRPESVTIQLLADGVVKETQTVTLNEWGQWVFTFNELPTHKQNGTPITYSVRENQVSGYNPPRYTVDGFTIVNKLESEPYMYPRVSVQKAASNSNQICVENGTIQMTLWVQNTGHDELYNVAVRDDLPAGAAYVEGTLYMSEMSAGDTARNVEFFNGRQRVDINIAVLPVNGRYKITYSMIVDDPSKIEAKPAYFNHGTAEPLKTDDPYPINISNIVAPCIKVDPTPEPIITPAPRPSSDNTNVEVLPKTGFAPNRVTKLVPMKVNYQEYNELRIEIPKLGVNAAILGVPFVDNNWDVSWLGENVGWLENTSYPGRATAGNTVLTGHLTNNYGLPGVFENLQTLSYGDRIVLHAFGKTLTYVVKDVMTVYADTPGVLSQNTELPELTLLTCKFYDAKTDQYSGRVVVKALLDSVQ